MADAMLELLRDLVVLRVAPDAEGLFEGPRGRARRAHRSRLTHEPARLRAGSARSCARSRIFLGANRRPCSRWRSRLATLPAGDDVAQLLARLDQLERRLAAGGGPASGGPGAAGGGPARPGHGQSGGARRDPVRRSVADAGTAPRRRSAS
ncbi:MAG: hypothetical protein R3E53_12985 [Myxococcota bacterium]